MSDNLETSADSTGQVIDEAAWRLQLRRANQSFRRHDWLASSIGFALGLLFLGLYVASFMDYSPATFMNHNGVWLPMLSMSTFMFALACFGYLSASRRYRRICAAVDQGIPLLATVRFVERKHSDNDIDAWFDLERNPKLSSTLVTRIWRSYPTTATPRLGVHRGFCLLDAQTRTPVAMTINDVTILFIALASTNAPRDFSISSSTGAGSGTATNSSSP